MDQGKIKIAFHVTDEMKGDAEALLDEGESLGAMAADALRREIDRRSFLHPRSPKRGARQR